MSYVPCSRVWIQPQISQRREERPEGASTSVHSTAFRYSQEGNIGVGILPSEINRSLRLCPPLLFVFPCLQLPDALAPRTPFQLCINKESILIFDALFGLTRESRGDKHFLLHFTTIIQHTQEENKKRKGRNVSG